PRTGQGQTVTADGTPVQLSTFRPARLHRIAGKPLRLRSARAGDARGPSFRTHGSATKRRMISNKSLRAIPDAHPCFVRNPAITRSEHHPTTPEPRPPKRHPTPLTNIRASFYPTSF